ncbi:gag-pol polyprotein, partial [Trifolium medium]|nr:gag-pol polyprotein [Trifolium medium]
MAVNTIAGGFAGGGESSSARKRYVRHTVHEICSIRYPTLPKIPEISFNAEDGRDVMPHDDDPLVIQVQILNCDVKRVLIDSGSSADILYWEAFKAMQLSDDQLKPYSGTLVRYLVVKTPFTSYNIIIGRPTFNALGAAMSTLYLAMKYPLDNGQVGV